ncbi:hypothetical protein [Pengzhenrongella phosphoraccumulans]|uniref:hypothetical protein n=1 Tax=Pengzhenrongella phosphoraccumulans TaxID=3114394 RepID=UPI00388CFB4C
MEEHPAGASVAPKPSPARAGTGTEGGTPSRQASMIASASWKISTSSTARTMIDRNGLRHVSPSPASRAACWASGDKRSKFSV